MSSNESFEADFSDEDAAIVMCGLSELLEGAPMLIDSIEIADSHAPAEGGAS